MAIDAAPRVTNPSGGIGETRPSGLVQRLARLETFAEQERRDENLVRYQLQQIARKDTATDGTYGLRERSVE
jgi:hypothetical protein